MSPKNSTRRPTSVRVAALRSSGRHRRSATDVSEIELAEVDVHGGLSSHTMAEGVAHDGGSEDEMEWEEVDVQAEQPTLSAPLEIEITHTPGPSTPIEITFNREQPQKRSEEDIRKRAASNAERLYRLEAHKLHTLSLLSSGRIRNRWLNDPVLQARLLSLTPFHLQTAFSAITKRSQPDAIRRSRMFETAIIRLTAWWASMFEVEEEKGIRIRTWDEVQVLNKDVLADRKGKKRVSFILRDDDPIRTTKSLMKHALMMKGSRDISAQLFTSLVRAVGVPARMVSSLQSVPWQNLKKSGGGTPESRRSSKGTANDSDNDNMVTSASESAGSTSAKKKGRSSVSVRRQNPSIPSDSGSAPYDSAGLSEFPVYWTEVFSRPDQRWLPVDPVRDLVNAKRKFEPENASRRNRMVYVVAFEEDGFARDVTARYTRQYGAKVMKSRPPSRPGYEWWEEVMLYLTRPYRLHRDDVEDAELQTSQLAEGMPNSVGAFKNHPLYALERHLRREETIHPRSQVGTFRGEPVFHRKHVVALKTAENWMRQGRKVKEGEHPLKSVRQRAVTLEKRRAQEMAELEGDEVTQGLYAKWQTELFEPDPIIDGVVPKNAFGNIDLYVRSMLPPGGVHLPYKGIARVAKKLGFDYAEAVTGFEFRKRRAVPILEGVVIAAENEDALLAAYWETAHIAEEQERLKKRERTLKRWVRLLQGLRIRERLLNQYSTDRTNGEKNDSTAVDENEEEQIEAGGFLTTIRDIVQPYQLPKAISYVHAHSTDMMTSMDHQEEDRDEWQEDPPETMTLLSLPELNNPFLNEEDASAETPNTPRGMHPLKTIAQMAAEEMHADSAKKGPALNGLNGSNGTETSNGKRVKATPKPSRKRGRADDEALPEPGPAVNTRSTRRSVKREVAQPPPNTRSLRPRKQKSADTIQAERELEEAIKIAAEESDNEDA